jgi:hypothetical protein
MQSSTVTAAEGPANSAGSHVKPAVTIEFVSKEEPEAPAIVVGSAATALTAATAGQLASCMISSTEQPYTMQDFAGGRPGRYSDFFMMIPQLVRLHVKRHKLSDTVLHDVLLQWRNICHVVTCRLTPVMELVSAKPPAFDATAVTIFSVDRLHHLPGLCALHLPTLCAQTKRRTAPGSPFALPSPLYISMCLQQLCILHLGAYRCGSWAGPLAAAVYLPVINRTQPLPPLAAEDAWMDVLQAQWEAEEAAAAADVNGSGDLDAALTAEDLAAAGALVAARQAVQAAFDR